MEKPNQCKQFAAFGRWSLRSPPLLQALGGYENTMILVSGRIYIVPGKRDEFLAASREAIILARATPECHEFIVAADPLEPNRVNIHEEWVSEMALEAFRGSGPGNDLVALIESADVSQRILSEGVT